MSSQKSPGAVFLQGLKTSLLIFIKTIKWILIILVIGGFLVGGASVGYVASLVKDDPIRDRETIIAALSENSETSFAYFNGGTLIGQLRSEIDQQMAEYAELPEHLKDAVKSIEDADFDKHIGVDVSGFLRAVKEKVLNGEIQTGGSTITQQLAKNVFLTTDQTMERKAKELFLALRVERYISKNEILLAYLNKVPFGKGATGYNVYGIKAAAKGIFNIENLHELNIAQSAYLAGLPQAPDSYRAYYGDGSFYEEGFQRALKRQHDVLADMLRLGKTTQEEYDEAINFDIKATLAKEKQRAYNEYPFLMIEIERRAIEALALMNHPELTRADLEKPEHADLLQNMSNQLLTGGYHIHTTIDQALYEAFTDVAQNEDNFLPFDEERGHEQIGAILLDNDTSAILAMIEGRDYYIEQLNHATQMVRQPGSTMKPIAAFLPALEAGYIQPASIIDDIPLLLEDGSKAYPHMPNNWNNTFHGLMTARHALNQSYNIPALKLFNDVVTIEQSWDFVRKLGIATLVESDYRARTGVIGGLKHGTRLDELTNAYTAIANQGQLNDTYMIAKIENSDEEPIYEHDIVPTPVFSEQTAFLMTDMLRTVISNGTGASIKTKFENYGTVPVAGKTGSTQLDRDAWFIGYSPDVTIGVWAGHDNNKPMKITSSLPQEESRQRAKNIWSILMDTTVELHPELFETTEFSKPDNIIQMAVSSVSGKLPSKLVNEQGKVITDYFNKDHVPTKVDDSLVKISVVQYDGKHYIPHPDTPADMTEEKILIKRPEPLYPLLDQIEEILKEMPKDQIPTKGGRTMTVNDYRPRDYDQTAPVEVDPRAYDQPRSELAPLEPPTGLSMIKEEGRNIIRLVESSNPNVVGYRFYRSYGGGDFVHRPHQKVLVGAAKMEISDWVSDQYDYAYYYTAVDISGRESAPSEYIYDLKTDNPPDEYLNGPTPPNHNGNDDDDDDNGSENNGPVPSAPQQLEVNYENGGLTVELKWKANSITDRVLHYNVYYSKEQNGNYRLIDTANTTRFKYIALPAEGWYQVSAVNEYGESERSAAVELSAEE